MNMKAILFSILVPIFYVKEIHSSAITYVCNSKGCRIQNEIKFIEMTDTSTNVFLTRSQDIIHSLIAKGFESISGISLKALSLELATVKWHVLTRGYLSPQGRLTGLMYNVETKSVFVDLNTVKKLSENEILKFSTSLIFLHEALGALGYHDEDYEISALLSAIDDLDEKHFEVGKPFFQNIILRNERRSSSPKGLLRPTQDANTSYILAEGGSTTVGGGGDPLMALIKKRTLQLALQERVSESFLHRLLAIRFERIITYFEKQKSGLTEISIYPLSFEDFKKSILVTIKDKKTTLLINVSEHSPIIDLEKHYLNYIKLLFTTNFQDEKK